MSSLRRFRILLKLGRRCTDGRGEPDGQVAPAQAVPAASWMAPPAWEHRQKPSTALRGGWGRSAVENHMPDARVAARKPSPAFQFYPDQFMADTVGLSAEERGAYAGLVCAAWRHRVLPKDQDRLRRAAGVLEASWPAVLAGIRHLLDEREDGWHIPMVDEAMARQDAFRDTCAEAGRRGGYRKHKGTSRVRYRKEKGTCSSSSSSSSSTSSSRRGWSSTYMAGMT